MREWEREREREDIFVSSECLIGGGTGGGVIEREKRVCMWMRESVWWKRQSVRDIVHYIVYQRL